MAKWKWRFKTCRLLFANVWNRKRTIIQGRILRRLQKRNRSMKRNLYSRRNLNSYIQLQTRRKLSLFYGHLPITEMQRRRKAATIPFLLHLERRLDVLLVRLHFCQTLPEARQLISHRKICVNNRVVNRSHFPVSHGDLISFFQEHDARIQREKIWRSFSFLIEIRLRDLFIEGVKIEKRLETRWRYLSLDELRDLPVWKGPKDLLQIQKILRTRGMGRSKRTQRKWFQLKRDRRRRKEICSRLMLAYFSLNDTDTKIQKIVDILKDKRDRERLDLYPHQMRKLQRDYVKRLFLLFGRPGGKQKKDQRGKDQKKKKAEIRKVRSLRQWGKQGGKGESARVLQQELEAERRTPFYKEIGESAAIRAKKHSAFQRQLHEDFHRIVFSCKKQPTRFQSTEENIGYLETLLSQQQKKKKNKAKSLLTSYFAIQDDIPDYSPWFISPKQKKKLKIEIKWILSPISISWRQQQKQQKERRPRRALSTHYSEVNHRTLKAVVSYRPILGYIPNDIKMKDLNLLLRIRNPCG